MTVHDEDEHVPQQPKRRHGSVIRDIAYVIFGRYGQYLITLVTLPLTARVLGPPGLGLLAVGMSSYFIGSLLGDLGITTYLAARVHDANLSRLRGGYLQIRGAILLVSLTGVVVAFALHAPQHVQMIALGLFGGALSAIGDDWVLVGEGRFGVQLVYQSIGRVLYLGLLVGLLPAIRTAEIALLCLIASSLVPVALSWWRTCRDHGLPQRPAPGESAEMLRLAVPVLSARLLENTYEQGVATLFSPALSSHSMGIFSGSDRVVQAASSSLDAIGIGLLPRLARRGRRDDDVRALWTGIRTSLIAVAALSLSVAIAISLTAQWIVPLLFGHSFDQSIPLMRLEAFILPGTAIASFVTTAVLPVLGDAHAALRGSLIGTAIIAVALIQAFRDGSPTTVVWGIIAAESAVALWHLVRLRGVRRRLMEKAVVA